MVDQRPFAAVGCLLEVEELGHDLLLDLVVVDDVVHRLLLLHCYAESQGRIQVAEQLVHRPRVDGEVHWDVGAENASLDTLDVPTHVRFGVQQMALPKGLLRRDVLVGQHNLLLIGLHHQ